MTMTGADTALVGEEVGDTVDIDTATHLRGAVTRVVRRLNAYATSEGLTPTEASVLGLVAARGPLRLAELAELEGLNPTMLSRVIAKLRTAGFITTQADPTDQRVQQAEATRSGSAAHTRIKRARAKVVSECTERMPADQVAALIAAVPALDALAAELSRGS